MKTLVKEDNNLPVPLKIVSIKTLTNQDYEETGTVDMEVDESTTESSFRIVSPGSVGKRFLAKRLTVRKKSAVKRLSVTDKHVSKMLEKSGESSDTDIEIVGEIIVTTANETKAQVEVTNKVGNPPTTPTITVDPRMSDKMPPTSDRASPTAA